MRAPLLPPGAAPPVMDRPAFRSAALNLGLAIIGSSVLPIPFAFRETGVALGLGAVCLAAGINYFTSDLIISMGRSGTTGDKVTYEDIGGLAFGRRGRRGAQAALLLLLLGTLCSSLAAMREVGTRGACHLLQGGATGGAVGRAVCGDGGDNILMCVVILLVVFPLSLLRRMRELDAVATVANLVLLVLVGVLVWGSVAEGLPALTTAWEARDVGFFFRVDERLPEAMAVLGFAMYIQPQLLPLCREMPPGPPGTLAMKSALKVVMAGATLLYGVVGFFSFARFGNDTKGDILTNLKGTPAAWLDVVTTLYLAVGFAPQHFTFRSVIENLIDGPSALASSPPPSPPPAAPSSSSTARHLGLTAAAVAGVASIVALTPPSYTETFFAITGATGVCVVCYVLPVLIHIRLASREGFSEGGFPGAPPGAGESFPGAPFGSVVDAAPLVDAAVEAADGANRGVRGGGLSSEDRARQELFGSPAPGAGGGGGRGRGGAGRAAVADEWASVAAVWEQAAAEWESAEAEWEQAEEALLAHPDSGAGRGVRARLEACGRVAREHWVPLGVMSCGVAISAMALYSSIASAA